MLVPTAFQSCPSGQLFLHGQSPWCGRRLASGPENLKTMRQKNLVLGKTQPYNQSVFCSSRKKLVSLSATQLCAMRDFPVAPGWHKLFVERESTDLAMTSSHVLRL